MAKLKHKAPMQYSVTYTVDGSATPNCNYYNVFHSSEALTDLLHTLNKGSIDGSQITIVSVEEFCPYNNKWLDRTEKALSNTDTTKLSVNGKNIKLNRNAVKKGA